MSPLVIFFHPNFSDGGVERTNLVLGAGLVREGYDVVFLTTTATDHFLPELKASGIRLKQLGRKRTLRTFWDVVAYLRALGRPDRKIFFVSCQYYVNVISSFVALALMSAGKHIVFINSERNHYVDLLINGGTKNRVILGMVRVMYRFCDLVVANSKETAEDLGTLISRPVSTVYNPTVNARFKSLLDEEVTEAWFRDDSRPCVIAVGRMTLQKGFDVLIDAFNKVRQSMDCRLLILGDGPLRPHLEAQVKRLNLAMDVSMPGFVANPYKFIRASQVFVLSSRYEGLPNVLIEAAHIGIPCVSTACKSGPSEILLDGEGGLLVPVDDSQALARAVIEVFENPDKSKKRAQAAAAATNRFSETNAVNGLIRVLYEAEKARFPDRSEFPQLH